MNKLISVITLTSFSILNPGVKELLNETGFILCLVDWRCNVPSVSL
jgi:hypothetical protein